MSKSQTWRVTLESGEAHDVLVTAEADRLYRADWFDSDAYGATQRLAVMKLAYDNRWPAVEILAPRAPSMHATPLPAPTGDGVWIPVRKGKPGEPVEITGWRKVKGITRYHVDHFGNECGNSELGYEGCEWIKYVNPIVRSK